MSRRWLARVAIVTGAAAALLGFSTAAWANVTVNINPGQLPATVDDFDTECNQAMGGGPFPGQDVWVFNLPEQDRDFVTVTATFSAPVGQIVIDSDVPGVDADGNDIVRIGTSKAWVVVPIGATLIAASAEITGDPEAGLQFVVTHTCPGLRRRQRRPIRRRRRTLKRQARVRAPARVTAPPVRARRRRPATCRRPASA